MIPLSSRMAALAAVLVAVAAIFGTGYWEGYRHEHAAWAADTARREKTQAVAIIARTAENAKLATQQQSTNATITKVNDEELASVRTRLAATERMRRPAFCGGSTAPAKAEGAASSPAADPAGGLVPEPMAADINALILRTEEVAATARACQAFVTENGMGP